MRSSIKRPTGLSASAVIIPVRKPKQRRRPRATLYSPPPSHTSNLRAVWMRPAPGSRRNITSPRQRRSQRQFEACLIFIENDPCDWTRASLNARLALQARAAYITTGPVTSRTPTLGNLLSGSREKPMNATIFEPDFLLETETARRLFHDYAKGQPIIDYHNHLPPEQIANDHRFENITELWLAGDHYKWRAMRSNGIPEQYCTGAASDGEKFQAWAKTVPDTLRNPLHHWTHLELKFPFGIGQSLNESTARSIYEQTQALLQTDAFSTQGLLSQFDVLVVCTTDDPTDTLEHHIEYAKSGAAQTMRMFPTWRPDNAMNIEDPEVFNGWVDSLSSCARMDINTFDQLLGALEVRHGFFHEQGCRASDHGLETAYSELYSLSEVRRAFDTLRQGQEIPESV